MSFVAVGAGAAVVGAGISAYGAIKSGAASAAQAQAQAQVDEQNAAAAAEEGATKLTNQQRQAEQVIGSEKANYAASGINIANGSASSVIQNSTYQAALDSAQINYETNAKITQYSEGAGNESALAGADITGSQLGAAASIFSGLGSAAGIVGKGLAPQIANTTVPMPIGENIAPAGATDLNPYGDIA